MMLRTPRYDEFLRDDTGNRRFIVIDIESLNHTHNIDVDLLWGQIVAMYLKGENTHLNQEEIKLNNDRNKVYFVKSDEQLIIEDILPPLKFKDFAISAQVSPRLLSLSNLTTARYWSALLNRAVYSSSNSVFNVASLPKNNSSIFCTRLNVGDRRL